MYPFLETIKLQDGIFYRLPYHQQRIDIACHSLGYSSRNMQLQTLLTNAEYPAKGLFKCRILYHANACSITFYPYQLKPINTLRFIDTQIPSYRYKMANRDLLNDALMQKKDCDDVLLVKEGLLTDTSYANIALFDGKLWVTPRIPLIYGTNRAFLLDKKIISEADIEQTKCSNFEKLRIFNAMIEFGDVELSTKHIQA